MEPVLVTQAVSLAAHQPVRNDLVILKTELHTHTADDPEDFIPHTFFQLIDRAAELGFGAVAVTLHNRQLHEPAHRAYARERGIVLIPGVERTIKGRHVLLLNFPSSADAESIRDFDELRRLKQRSGGLVVAPHPFFPLGNCLGSVLETHPDVFDAIEINGFHSRRVDFNQRARRWAQSRGKPLVGNGDVHRLPQLGPTHSLIDADPDPDAICEAIRQGRVEVRAEPLGFFTAAMIFGRMVVENRIHQLRDQVRGPRRAFSSAVGCEVRGPRRASSSAVACEVRGPRRAFSSAVGCEVSSIARGGARAHPLAPSRDE